VLQTGAGEIDISLAQYLEVWECAVRKTRCSDLPMRAATSQSADSFGVVGFSCILSPTVGDAFTRLTRIYAILITAARWSLEKQGECLCIIFDLDAPPQLGTRCAIEFAMAEQVHFTRLMAAGKVEVIEATFPHQAPPDETGYRELFRCPLHWNQERATLIV